MFVCQMKHERILYYRLSLSDLWLIDLWLISSSSVLWFMSL